MFFNHCFSITMVSTFTALCSFALVLSGSIHIRMIDNGLDMRIVAGDSSAYCNWGRVELFDGLSWGSLSDCSHAINYSSPYIADSFCQVFDWDPYR